MLKTKPSPEDVPWDQSSKKSMQLNRFDSEPSKNYLIILLYPSFISSGVWGYKKHHCIEIVQNRALRYFLGVHRITPLLGKAGGKVLKSATK